MTITPFYGAILGVILVGLSIRILLLRRRLRVSLGNQTEELLERAVSVHSNFCEYTPLALLLIWFLERLVNSSLWIHVLCVALVAGRCLHAYGVSQTAENYRYRMAGMTLTLAVIVSTSTRIMATVGLPLGS